MKQATPTKYEQMGIAALLPGMTFAVELIQKQLDEMRAQLTGIVFSAEKRAVGRPKGSKNKRMAAGGQSWAGLTPEERSAEMKHRMALAKKNKAAQQAAPVNGKDPKYVAAGKAAWTSRSKKAQREHIARMKAALAAKRAAQAKHVNGAAA